MKKVFPLICVLAFASITFLSCKYDTCKNCRIVVYYSDGSVYSDDDFAVEYCNDELDDILEEEDTQNGPLTNSWVCQ